MKTISVLSLFIFLAFNLRAQEVSQSLISSAGDYFETENISLSWSIGEVVTETFSTNDLFVTQGFQQSIDNTTFQLMTF